MDEFRSPRLVSAGPTTSISDLLIEHARHRPAAVLLRRHDAGAWVDRSAAEVLAEVAAVAKGFLAAGIEPGDRIAIMSRTRYEWTILDFAAWHAGAVPVPVYETSSPSQVEWILSDSGARAVVVETSTLAAVVEEVRAGLPALEHVWQIDDGALETLVSIGADVSDDEVDARHQACGRDDLATIIYTSGTTGRPKGAELTHGNFVELSLNAIERLHV
ncbi:MAG TPA: AMP-binding protein, partial [Actinotalea sp.]|nr:AMP-binding protein [Actinotalea sp.]